MHELSVAMEICRIAEERLAPGDRSRLLTVGVDMGDESGLEPENLRFCLETLLSGPPFGAARPIITRLPGDTLRVTYLEIEDGGSND
jgi:Zn finger protein HypA/HybF involved in hydrogenase expression